MPELPEVESIARGLRQELIGFSFSGIGVNKPVVISGPLRRKFKEFFNHLLGRKIIRIERYGKRLVILWDKNSSNAALIIQLGMTGGFTICPPDLPRARHTHIIFRLSNNKDLRFTDPRRFGRVWLVENFNTADPYAAMESLGLGRLGPDALNMTKSYFLRLFDSERIIKSLLLDQQRLAGLGNIYADESLFAAGIHPAAIARRIKTQQREKLYRQIRRILRLAIAHGGTTFSDFRNAYGELGNFKKYLYVYQRTRLPCRRCRTAIQRIVIAGRSSHFCPSCQEKQ